MSDNHAIVETTTQIANNKPTQLSLWYDTPLAKSIPNRPLDRNEMYIVVCVQQAIQNLIDSKEQITEISIDTGEIAAARGKRPRDIRRQCLNAVETLSKNFFTQQIIAYREGSLRTVGAFAMYTAILQDENGIIHVTPNPKYVDYYKEFVASSPDLQIPATFYLHSSSQYSYNLANWLIASIYEIRKKTQEFKLNYSVQVKEEDLRAVVPPSKPDMTKSAYRSRVLGSAIKDINKNAHSPLQITELSSIHSPSDKRDTIGYQFDVEILPTKEQPIFLPNANTKAIDNNDLPPWDVIDGYMKRLGCDTSFRHKVYANGREQAFKAYLRVIAQPKNRHNGRYFNTVYNNPILASIYSLCLQIRNLHPELVDDYIAGVIKKHQIQEFNVVQEAVKTKEPRIKKPEDIQDPHLREIYVKVQKQIEENEKN